MTEVLSETEGRRRLVEVAHSWVGTPFHNNAEVKGAGVDCARLLKCVFRDAGLIPDIHIPHYSPQHFLHHDEEKFLGWVIQFAHEIPRDQTRPGDVALYKIGKCFGHGAIIIEPGWPQLIHAHFWSRRVRKASARAMHLGMPIIEIKWFCYNWQQ